MHGGIEPPLAWRPSHQGRSSTRRPIREGERYKVVSHVCFALQCFFCSDKNDKTSNVARIWFQGRNKCGYLCFQKTSKRRDKVAHFMDGEQAESVQDHIFFFFFGFHIRDLIPYTLLLRVYLFGLGTGWQIPVAIEIVGSVSRILRRVFGDWASSYTLSGPNWHRISVISVVYEVNTPSLFASWCSEVQCQGDR